MLSGPAVFCLFLLLAWYGPDDDGNEIVHIIEQRQTVDLTEGGWRLGSIGFSELDGVTITEVESGQDLPLWKAVNSNPDWDFTAPESISTYRLGSVTVENDGPHLVKTTDGTLTISQRDGPIGDAFDFAATVVFGAIAGGGLFLLGLIVMGTSAAASRRPRG